MMLYRDVPLRNFSYWKVGGEADFLYIVDSLEELVNTLNDLKKRKIPFLVIGNSTNLLFSDLGVRGALIKLGPGFSDFSFKDDTLTVSSGAFVPLVVRQCVNIGLSGLEHLIGVPATLGGAIYMNAGSQRKSLSSNIIVVNSIDESGSLIERSVNDCKFAYRESIFQCNSEIIISSKIRLETKPTKLMRRECLGILKSRNEKFPRDKPSCGSVFVSNPLMYETFGPPGRVIENVGLKGFKVGGASISAKHANFIVNDGNASAKDVLTLIALAINKVQDKTGFMLKSEAKFVSEHCDFIDADYAALNLL